MKKALKVVLCVLGAVVALAALGILFLTITEYRPADVEQLEVIFRMGEPTCSNVQVQLCE